MNPISVAQIKIVRLRSKLLRAKRFLSCDAQKFISYLGIE